VCHAGKLVQGGTANPLGRRIGADQFGILFLQPLQLAKKRIILGIGDRRCVEHIVEPIVLLQLASELINPLSGGIFRAGDIKKR